MASQGDDNKLECISNINKQQERYFLNVYKKHEYILNSKHESFENKIESLIDVWKSVGELNLSQFDLRHVIQIMDWAKLHALNIVLTAEWNNFKAMYETQLLDEIEKAQNELLKLNSAFATRCKKLADVVRNPWEDPVLMKLMRTKDAEIVSEDIEFFCVETAYMVSVRLKKLCESHCEDLALNLVTAFMNCNKLSKTQNFNLNATETQMWFIFDIYIALLYKFQKKQKIVVLLKELPFDQGLQLVKRFAKKRVKISKIWKNCHKIAILAAQLYISQIVVKYTGDLKEFLDNYIEIYISLCNNEALFQDFSTSIRRISNLADAAGLYVFCAVMQRKAGVELKPLVIEMYIRALTTDMNELERQKDANEIEKVTSTTSRLAEAFCNLADFLDEHEKVARECVLTAFSLEPTKRRLECIEALAKRSGFQVLDTGQDWKCKLHPPTLPSDDITWVCTECGDYMSKPEFNAPIKINMALNEALQNSVLGISESLCDDLVVCLSNPRYQILSWFLPWQDLHRLCLMYLQDPQATKNIVTELKFVDIDYSIFKGIKREPHDELDGIERGYEQYLDQDFVSDEETSSNSEDSMSQDSRPSLGSDGAGEGSYLPMLPAQVKSDPNTLKSLRMFRHNLKRGRDKDVAEETPEKMFKPGSNASFSHAVSSSVDPSKVETKTSTSLNQFLNGVTTKYPAIQYPSTSDYTNSSEKDFQSKNVKTATLPLLGGQVAKMENTLIQVSLQQPNNSLQQKGNPLMLTPHLHKQTDQKKVTKKDVKVKAPNKPLQNGLKENNSRNMLSKDFRLPSAGLKVYSRKIPKNPNTLLVVSLPRTQLNQTQPTSKSETFKINQINDASAQQLIQSPPHQTKNTPIHSTSVTNQNNLPPKESILSTQPLNQIQLQRESCNQQVHSSVEQRQTSAHQMICQGQPLVPSWAMEPLEVNTSQRPMSPANNFFQCRQVQVQQNMESRSENTPIKDIPSLTTIAGLNENPPLIHLIEANPSQTSPVTIQHKQSVNPEQSPVKDLISIKDLQHPVINQEKVNLSVQQFPDNHLNKLLENPINPTSLQKEAPAKKPLENCSNQSPIRELLSEEQKLQIKPVPCKPYQHRIIPSESCHSPSFLEDSPKQQVVPPLYRLSPTIQEVSPTYKQPVPILKQELVKLTPNQVLFKQPANNHLQEQHQESQQQSINNLIPSSNLEQRLNPLVSTEETPVRLSKVQRILSPNRSPLQFNLQQETEQPVNKDKKLIEPTISPKTQPQPALIKPTVSPKTRPQRESLGFLLEQVDYITPEMDAKLKQLAIPLTSRSTSLTSYCNLPKAPNHCLNSDRLPTSRTSQIKLQTRNHNSEIRKELSNRKQNKTLPSRQKQILQKPQGTETKISPKRAEISCSLRVRLDNLRWKLDQTKSIPRKQPQPEGSTKISQPMLRIEIVKADYQMLRNSCNSLNIINKNNSQEVTGDTKSTSDTVLSCNNKSNCKTSDDTTVEAKSNDGVMYNESSNSEVNVRFDNMFYQLFSDVQENFAVACHKYLNPYLPPNKNECIKNDDPEDNLPKNKNLTENIRTYTRKSKQKLLEEYKDCVKTLTGVNILDVCKNVNRNNSTENLHSSVQNIQTKPKELQIVLDRLPSNKKNEGKCTSIKDENTSIKLKCDRGKAPPKYSRRRKSVDESENKVGKAPNQVQNHNLSPLQDVNLRVNSQLNAKICSDFNKPNALDENKGDCPGSERTSGSIKSPDITDVKEKKAYHKLVLSNVPGLNDFEMVRPISQPQVVNVVQVSGGRSAQNVSIQNSQTSTQVTPHIQRIGQPRIAEQKPELSNSVTSTTSSTTSATSRTTSTQPSTLINMLSQQMLRPVASSTNATRRPGPLINIISHEIIRQPVTTKAVVHSTTANSSSTNIEATQVKVAVSTEQPLKTTNAVVKNTNTVTTAQGGTILQFICKSSLPKFQQAFGKTVYQTNTEAADSSTTTVEVANSAASEVKKTITTKTVPVNLQPIPGSVIYSRQLPAGQAISLLPPGTTTTRQVFRIATSNAEQLGLVKDSVIHSKMSALLAAALQGRPKNADGEIILNSEEINGAVVRPALVQGARIVKPVQLQMATNVVRTNAQQPNLSSTTLEQLREFDMVYKQIKERSTTSISETCTNSEGQEGAPQRISVTYVNQLQKYTQLSPVVVVTSYSSLQPAASPALSVTSQGSSSPCVTPASTPTLPKLATKNSKGKTIKTTTTNTSPTKSSPIPKPQQKPQEDEHTTQRIFDILAEYAEQLRNSPDLNNKPAPRRRSNPPTNPSQNSKRKKSSSGVKKSGQSSNTIDMDADDITIGSEDSSGGGVVQLSVTDDEQSQASTSVNTTESSSENPSPPSTRPVILAEGGPCTNQSRNLIIADSSVGEALKIPNTAVIVPGSYIMPVSMVKGGQQIAVVSGGSKILATVPARSGQNMLLFQSFTNQSRKAISAVKYSTIQPLTSITTQTLAGVSQQPVLLPSTVALGQPLTLKRIGGEDRENSELLLAISQPKEDIRDANDIPQPDSSTSVSSDSVDIKLEDDSKEEQSDNSNEKIFQTYQKTVINSVETSVIATAAPTSKTASVSSQTIVTTSTNAIKAEQKSGERIQSVLVTACSSNGPMLSHTNPRYRKVSDKTHAVETTNKGDFLHNGEKPNIEPKNFRGTATYYVNKAKKVAAESQKIDCEMQKQAAIERELRLQKSLSEECEDLGVDEPSTSDLFPEADLLFDSNHSPSFDQTSQDVIKRTSHVVEIKEEVKESMNLFSDDENSSSLRADLFEYVEYQPVESALNYQGKQINGNIIEAGSSSCDDNTLLPKCAAMSEVTLNSPISPEMYQEATMHKYKFKYSNRKKGEKIKQGEYGGEVVSSSEDTVVCTEIANVNFEETYKVVHLAKSEIVKEGKCELHCEEDVDSPSGRGARRSVRKLCSCCNGAQDGNLAKKRPHTSRPHTLATPHKKAFLNKKR